MAENDEGFGDPGDIPAAVLGTPPEGPRGAPTGEPPDDGRDPGAIPAIQLAEEASKRKPIQPNMTAPGVIPKAQIKPVGTSSPATAPAPPPPTPPAPVPAPSDQ